MDKKPNVFPTQGQPQTNTEPVLNQEVPSNDPIAQSQPPAGELAAAEEMRRRTAEELKLRDHAMAQTAASKDAGEQARAALMAEMGEVNPNTRAQNQPQVQQQSALPSMTQEIQEGAMSYEDMVRFQKYTEEMQQKQATTNVEVPPSSMHNPIQAPNYVNTPPPVVPPSNIGQPQSMLPPQQPDNVYIQQLSQPQMNAAFDVIPLPSEGKLYGLGKKSIKVAYMSTADENILTSPNLLTSGDFLEILFNRKILEPNLRYRDLIEGDRNAIMLWLRATGYGHMYPIVVEDEKGDPFETEVNLNDIKTIKLNVNPDANGHFEFKLPVSGIVVKFKLLTVGETDDISERVEYEVDVLKLPVNNTNTYTLAKQLVSINGDTNPEMISSFSENMRVGDGKALREYIESINCGVDMSITVGTPGGGSIDTFLPLNLKFFWPNL